MTIETTRLTAALGLVLAVGAVAGCGSKTTTSTDSGGTPTVTTATTGAPTSAPTGCKAGDPVEAVPGKPNAAPACASVDGVMSMSSGCYPGYPKTLGPQKGVWWLVEPDASTWLIGKAGGKWIPVPANSSSTQMREKLGC